MSRDGYLPPGVEYHDLPGERPEDQEVDVELTMTVGDIEELRLFIEVRRIGGSDAAKTDLYHTIKSMLQQIDEQYKGDNHGEPDVS